MDEVIVVSVGLAVLTGILSALSHPNYRDALGGALVIIFVASVLSPTLELISGAFRLPDFEPQLPSADSVTEYTEEGYISAIADYLAAEFDLPREKIEISGEGFSLSSLSFFSLEISLSGSAVFSDTSRMRELLLSEFVREGGRVSISLDFGGG